MTNVGNPQPQPQPPAPAPVGNNKWIASGISGAVVVVVMWVLQQFAHVMVPPEVAAALTTIIGTALVYFVPHGGG
jgi:uncharacterized membrane-anchored protein